MNLFTQYGVKEVADVTFYSIIQIGDEEFYLPVLYLDTLKVSNLAQKISKVSASGGYGNHQILGWSQGKNISLKLQDALFTPAAASLYWGGWLNQRFTKFTKAIAKISVTIKYYNLHYSPYAYKSPELTPEEWNVVYFCAGAEYWQKLYKKDQPYIEENRTNLRKMYNLRRGTNFLEVFEAIISKIQELILNYSRYANFSTVLYDAEVIDRFEDCIVENECFKISKAEQMENLVRQLQDDKSSTYNIYYDKKTLLPFITDEGDEIILNKGTHYLKWTRYVKYKEGIDDSTLGKQIEINTDTFPGYFRIVGETHIREQKTGKDQRYQFIIPKAKINNDTNLTLEAAGDPSIFDLTVDVIAPPDDIVLELKQFDVEKDCLHGGTRIVPQQAEFTRTNYSTKVDETQTHSNIEIW